MPTGNAPGDARIPRQNPVLDPISPTQDFMNGDDNLALSRNGPWWSD